MSARTWVTSLGAAIGVAVGAGAAQLGVGYGLSIIAWLPASEGSARSLWLANLAWITWLSGNSTIFGALFGNWTSSRRGEAEQSAVLRVIWRIALATAAAIGSLIMVPLVAIPARVADRSNESVQHFTAGGYAVVGIIIGLVIAVCALSIRAVAANVLATAGMLWLLAAGAVAQGLHNGVKTGTAQLAIWQFQGARWVRNMVNVPSALLMLAIALVIGIAAAWYFGRAGDNRLGVGVSGAIGPLLVALAYFLAVPDAGGRDQQLSAYVIAPYALIAGIAGSILVAAIGPKGSRRRSKAEREAREALEAEEHAQWQRSLAEQATRDLSSDSPTYSTEAYESDEYDTEDYDSVDYASEEGTKADHVAEDTGSKGSATKPGQQPESDSKQRKPIWPEKAKPTSRRRKGR
jgi:hypothetical protein